MPISAPRDPLLAALAPRFEAAIQRTRAVVAGLPADKMGVRPPGGGWSVGEVFEHLVRGNEAYLGTIAKALARARARGSGRPYRPSFMGGLLLNAIEERNPRRLPSAPRMRPVTVRADVVQDFLATLERTAELAREADGADLTTRIWSPIAPLPLNLGDAFAVVVTHAERHLGQAERTRRAIGA